RAGPHDFLKYGYYQENLERYLEHVEDSQIRCVIFERFVQETQTVVDEVCDFLGLEAAIDVDEVNTHRNRARVPRFPGLKRLTNALGSNREATLYSDHLPDGAPTTSLGLGERVRRSVQSLLDDVALLASKSDYPPMDPETRDFLTSEFKRHNPNLSSLVGRDVSDWWEGW
ncbi:MAG: sulfotransferase domain-containing protein, partial [Bradymonadaceae bacterium]